MQLLHQINLKTRMQAVRFAMIASRELMLVACEDGRVRVFELPPIGPATAEPSILAPIGELVGHASRCAAVARDAADLAASNRSRSCRSSARPSRQTSSSSL